MTHVFVVDETTFRVHLEYMFAGTGAQDKTSDFLIDANTNLVHSTTERNLTGMIADVSRIRIGDKIIFYLQAGGNRQGMFFGVFQAISTAFFDENDDYNYLVGQLDKGLSYRVRIQADSVFPLGVTEHEYLDSLRGKMHPSQLCWSLIYRKLKGNRGCTMITDFEYEDLLRKLGEKNQNRSVRSDNFSFDRVNERIIGTENNHEYLGRQNSIGIIRRLLYKANRYNAFESHLQAYIMQNFDSEILREFLLPLPQNNCWIGNEVSCGVGMQRIDIMIKQEDETDIYLKIIELKCTEPYCGIIHSQIPWYIEWVNDYITPNYIESGKTIHIIPCVIAKTTDDIEFIRNAQDVVYTTEAINTVVEPLEYIGFNISAEDIGFARIV